MATEKKGTTKKLTLRRRYRRWKRRVVRRHPGLQALFAVLEGLLGFLPMLLIAVLIIRALPIASGAPDAVSDGAAPTSIPAAASAGLSSTETPSTERPSMETPAAEGSFMPDTTPAPTATAMPTATPEPTPEPTPIPAMVDGIPEEYFYQSAAPGADYSDPAQNNLTSGRIYADGKAVESYVREDGIHMVPSSEYSALEGVTTFRGSNYRDGGAYGTIPENPTGLDVIWSKRIGHLDSWTGVGWTGQGSAVLWPDELRQAMNITDEKKANENLVELIYATLDGNIYFLDMADGEETRDSIDIGAPIKGSLTIDPRGYPLLYCGQGIYDVEGKRVPCGTRIWSLLDQSLLYAIDGKDEFAVRPWRAFDCAPLVDAGSDTMITAGENGVLYTVDLNTSYTGDSISIDPVVDRYVYTQSVDGQVGTENSIVAYNNYVYFANNVGIIQCVDMNTMTVVWSFNGYDDIDASMALEVEADGTVGLYVTNEVDNRGSRGSSHMFKLNALTGELLWMTESDPVYQNDENGGGSFATLAIGKQGLSDLVYFHVARTVDSGGMLYALDKTSGSVVWSKSMGRYGWCSPTCLYTESGRGYVLVGSSNGLLRLFDGLTGETVASVDLEANIEGTPVVFNNILAVGTRGGRIYGVKVS